MDHMGSEGNAGPTSVMVFRVTSGVSGSQLHVGIHLDRLGGIRRQGELEVKEENLSEGPCILPGGSLNPWLALQLPNAE